MENDIRTEILRIIQSAEFTYEESLKPENRKELGYPYVIESPWGLAGPKGMDPKVVAKIDDAFKKAISEKGVIETLARFDMVPNYMNSADYTKAVADQIKIETELLSRLGLLKKD